MNVPEIEVVADDRGRVQLRGLVDKNKTYVGRRFADGSILLEPAIAVPRRELRDPAHPELPGVQLPDVL